MEGVMTFEEWYLNVQSNQVSVKDDLRQAWVAAIDEAVKVVEKDYMGCSEQYEQDGFDLADKIKELKE